MARPCSNACERRGPAACQLPRYLGGRPALLRAGTMPWACSNAWLSGDTSTPNMHLVRLTSPLV